MAFCILSSVFLLFFIAVPYWEVAAIEIPCSFSIWVFLANVMDVCRQVNKKMATLKTAFTLRKGCFLFR